MNLSFSDFLALPAEQSRKRLSSILNEDLAMALAGLPEEQRHSWLKSIYHDSPALVAILLEETRHNAGNAKPGLIQQAQDKIARMVSTAETYPYNTPPWRRNHGVTAPDGSVAAGISEARETGMSQPTSGTLRISDWLALPNCNPAFLFSDDSKYLAVPVWARRFGLFLGQRLAIVDLVKREVWVSPKSYWLLQPETFMAGKLVVLESPTKSAKRLEFAVPEALKGFRRI